MHTAAPAAMREVVYLLRPWIMAFNTLINQTTKKNLQKETKFHTVPAVCLWIN
jgi:hypothetical protein